MITYLGKKIVKNKCFESPEKAISFPLIGNFLRGGGVKFKFEKETRVEKCVLDAIC